MYYVHSFRFLFYRLTSELTWQYFQNSMKLACSLKVIFLTSRAIYIWVDIQPHQQNLSIWNNPPLLPPQHQSSPCPDLILSCICWFSMFRSTLWILLLNLAQHTSLLPAWYMPCPPVSYAFKFAYYVYTCCTGLWFLYYVLFYILLVSK